MTIDEAIELNEDIRAIHLLHREVFAAQAIELGIEALKLLRDHRNEVYFRYDLLLPGETEK